MKREQFYILVYLLKQKCIKPGSAMTGAEIQQGLMASGKEIKKTAFYKHMKICRENGWIACGLAAGRAETYYVTDSGSEAAREFGTASE